MSKAKVAVVIPWRDGETDLDATVKSASASIGKGAKIYPVEDKRGDGPGQTRHRGIEAASDADVIILADAHMRFRGRVLNRMAKQVYEKGGLLCAKCYHNDKCSWEGTTATGAPCYYGARIVWRAQDGWQKDVLAGKWSHRTTPGPVGCIMGAAYVFRRDWYYQVGQPLAALPGWGSDEEILSIAAWMSGYQPEVFDGDVAHQYRAKTPWKGSRDRSRASRMALIHMVVTDPGERYDLKKWQSSESDRPIPGFDTFAVERVRLALLQLPRTYAQWKAQVCEVDEINGIPRITTPPAPPSKFQPVKRVNVAPRANYGATENRRECQHCGSVDSDVTKTVKSNRLVVRYRTCRACGTRRTTQEVLKEAAGQ